MQKGRQAMRRVVLRALFEHLEESYNLEFPHEASFRNNLAPHQIDALIAFKSDERLDALRGALDRLDRGTFGTCLSCKRSIEQKLLDQDPSRVMCAVCERKFSAVEHIRQPWMPTYIQ
jgi:RNA polymerase-binding transcription factor DksA